MTCHSMYNLKYYIPECWTLNVRFSLDKSKPLQPPICLPTKKLVSPTSQLSVSVFKTPVWHSCPSEFLKVKEKRPPPQFLFPRNPPSIPSPLLDPILTFKTFSWFSTLARVVPSRRINGSKPNIVFLCRLTCQSLTSDSLNCSRTKIATRARVRIFTGSDVKWI